MGLFTSDKKKSLDKGLEKTKESVFKKLSRAVVGKSRVDDEVLDKLEEVLITSDVGVDTTLRIIERIENRVSLGFFHKNTSRLNNVAFGRCRHHRSSPESLCLPWPPPGRRPVQSAASDLD